MVIGIRLKVSKRITMSCNCSGVLEPSLPISFRFEELEARLRRLSQRLGKNRHEFRIDVYNNEVFFSLQSSYHRVDIYGSEYEAERLATISWERNEEDFLPIPFELTVRRPSSFYIEDDRRLDDEESYREEMHPTEIKIGGELVMTLTGPRGSWKTKLDRCRKCILENCAACAACVANTEPAAILACLALCSAGCAYNFCKTECSF